jgi:transposase
MGASRTSGPARQTRRAILYLLRTGCPWRYLPREGFPPRSTVYNMFRNFQKAGTWDAIWEQLHMDLREDMGREASASAAIILEVGGKRGGS